MTDSSKCPFCGDVHHFREVAASLRQQAEALREQADAVEEQARNYDELAQLAEVKDDQK